MAARRPFWKWQRWKSIGFCLWPPSTCIWNLKLKFQSKLDLCSGNHVVYRQTDGRTDGQTDRRTDKVNPVYPPSNFVGRGYNEAFLLAYQCVSGLINSNIKAHFLPRARSKLRLCSSNHRQGYWSNLPCDRPSTAWAYSEQGTENAPSPQNPLTWSHVQLYYRPGVGVMLHRCPLS